MNRVPHGRIEPAFDADDLDRRVCAARGDGIAGDQPAAADRDDENVEVGRVFQHFERDGALTGDDVRIVVRMHPDQIALGRDRLGARLRFGERLAVEHDVGAMRLGGFDFHERRRHRHDNGGGDIQAPGVIGHRLGMVAGRHGDDAAAALFGRQGGELDAGAALLERIGDLQILVFDEDLGTGKRRQRRRGQERRAQHMAVDGAPGGLDVGQRHHGESPAVGPRLRLLHRQPVFTICTVVLARG
jgi:hypothetical protein